MLTYKLNKNNTFWIKDPNFSHFYIGPFKNIRIKGKRLNGPENLNLDKKLKTRKDRIGKYNNTFFIKTDGKTYLYPILKSKKQFEGLILHKILGINVINKNKLNIITNYKFEYKTVELLPNIKFFYVKNLDIQLLPLLNGLFGKYLFSFKYIFGDEIKFNIPFEIDEKSINTIQLKTNKLLKEIKEIKQNNILLGKTIKNELHNKIKDILLQYIKLIINLFIIITNLLKEEKKLKEISDLPTFLTEYKATSELLQFNIKTKIDKYFLFYQKLTKNFYIYIENIKLYLGNLIKF